MLPRTSIRTSCNSDYFDLNHSIVSSELLDMVSPFRYIVLLNTLYYNVRPGSRGCLRVYAYIMCLTVPYECVSTCTDTHTHTHT